MIAQRGIYSVGQQQFYEKIPALIYASRTNQSVSWSFGDEYFSQFDWSKEPAQSLSQLYIDRCQQLRDTYEYLVLFYSGGSDSHNILTHFIKAGIHIDEIITYHAIEYYQKKQKANSSTDSTQLQNEWYYTGLPDFKNLVDLIPNTKLTLFDTTQSQLTYTINDEWLHITGEYINAGFGQKTGRYTFDSRLIKTIESKKIGFVYGIDKPRVFCVDDIWYLSFLDIIAGQPARLPNQFKDADAHVEHFYWSDQSVSMLIKQAHMIKNFYETNIHLEPPSNKKISPETKKKHDMITRSVVYPYWREDVFQIEKPSILLNESEQWVLNENETLKQEWLLQYWNIIDQIDSRFYHISDQNGMPDSFVGFWSKWHRL